MNVPALALAVSVVGAGTAYGQTAELPSSPTPNSSSKTNPYFGSVTLHPATDEVVKLSLDDAVSHGLMANLGLKEAEEDEKSLHGQKITAIQYFLPSITVTGTSEVHEYNLAALGFGPGLLKKISGAFPGGLLSNLS